jgi:hypothetical protein
MKDFGPITEPWGTPVDNGTGFDELEAVAVLGIAIRVGYNGLS